MPGRNARRLAVPFGAALALSAAAPALAAGSSDAGFIPGSASAVAQAIRVAPATAGLSYTVTIGSSVAGYDDSQGKAQAQTLDLGVIGTTLTGEQCDGSAPPLKQSQLPQPVIAESTEGTQTKKATTAGGNGMPAAVGTAVATATGTPSGAATTKGTSLDVPGLISVDGATTTATGKLVKDTAREATADATIGTVRLLDGQVVLRDLHWQAHQRTGQGKAADGGFTVGGVTVAGKPVPLSSGDLGSALSAVNKALAPTGLQLTPPTLTKKDDGTVEVGPLVIGIGGSQLGRQVVGPVMDGAQPVREALFKALTGFSCKFSTPFLLGDIATGPVSGGGSLRILLGGISVGSEGIRYANPFDSFDLGAGAVTGGLAGGSAALSGSAGTAAGLGGALPTGGAGSTATGGAASAPQIAGRPVVESRSCSSTHPGGGDCAPHAALAVGLAGLGAVLLVGAADLVLGGGRRRRLPQLRL